MAFQATGNYNQDVAASKALDRAPQYESLFKSQPASVQSTFNNVFHGDAASNWAAQYATTLGGGEGGGGAEGGGSEFGDMFSEFADRQKEMSDYLENEFKAYIRGERGIGQDFVKDTLKTIQPSLLKEADLLKGQAFKSANARGLYRSSVPDQMAGQIDRTYLTDLGNIEGSLNLQRKTINMEQQRFGATGLAGLAGTNAGFTLGLGGLDLQQQLGQMQNSLGLAQLSQQGSQFDQSLAFSQQALQAQLAQQNRASRNQKTGAIGQGLGTFGGLGLMGALG